MDTLLQAGKVPARTGSCGGHRQGHDRWRQRPQCTLHEYAEGDWARHHLDVHPNEGFVLRDCPRECGYATSNGGTASYLQDS